MTVIWAPVLPFTCMEFLVLGSVTGIGMKIKDKAPGCLVVGTDPVGSILADPTDKTQQFYEVSATLVHYCHLLVTAVSD